MSHQIDAKAKFLLMLPKNVEIFGNFTDILFLYSISQKELKTQNAKKN
jgi:hypothetical protein